MCVIATHAMNERLQLAAPRFGFTFRSQPNCFTSQNRRSRTVQLTPPSPPLKVPFPFPNSYSYTIGTSALFLSIPSPLSFPTFNHSRINLLPLHLFYCTINFPIVIGHVEVN